MQPLLINDYGEPPEPIQRMVRKMVDDLIAGRKKLGGQANSFYICAVQSPTGKDSFWGVLDLKEIPEEDIFVEAYRRFYAAFRMLGPHEIRGFGLVDVQNMLDRRAWPVIQA